MGVQRHGVGCGCCRPAGCAPSVLTVTVRGCGNATVPGQDVLLKQGGATVATVATNGSGQAVFNEPPLVLFQDYEIHVEPYQSGYATPAPVTHEATCGATGRTITLAPLSTHVCLVGAGCPNPQPKTLHATVGTFSFTLSNTAGTGWSGSATYSGAGRTGTFCQTIAPSVTATVSLSLSIGSGGTWSADLQYKACQSSGGTCGFVDDSNLLISPTVANASGTLDCNAPIDLSATLAGLCLSTLLGGDTLTITE